MKVIVLVQENKNYLRTRKLKSRNKRHTEDLEDNKVIEDFTLIKYLLSHNKYGGVLNRSFWIQMFKQMEISIGPRLPKTIRGTSNDVLDPLIPSIKVSNPTADCFGTYRSFLLGITSLEKL